jgi:hypothetical protein
MIHNSGITAETSAAALVVDGAQPVWMTLNEARERAFTGEIVFETNPEVLAYLDHGIVYYAERATDASLGRRLLDAGVIDVLQLDRGTVRVGDIEHLGRLFDRDPSVDRDAVVVVAELATEELIADLANGAIAGARVTAYRHHPSGVHRWFVAPLDLAIQQRPVSAVAQLDSTVVDQLPGLPFGGSDELTIEWDHQTDDAYDNGDVNGDEVASVLGFDETLLDVEHQAVVEDFQADGFDDEVFELSLDLAEFTDENVNDMAVDDIVDGGAVDDPALTVTDGSESHALSDDVVAEPVLALNDLVDVETADTAIDEATTNEAFDDFDFAVVWPDGSEAPAAGVEPAGVLPDLHADETAVAEADDGTIAFTMPPLDLSDEPEQADAEVPDDVAEAVRRAIAAIESATAASTPVAPMESTPAAPDATATEVTSQLSQITDDFNAVTPGVEVSADAGFGAFAPPTMATRAEVLYGQMTDDGQMIDETDKTPRLPSVTSMTDGAMSPGVASVVFVDEPTEDLTVGGDNDRSSALRRLIGGLRRKDH